MMLIICPLRHIDLVIERYSPRFMVSLLSPEADYARPSMISEDSYLRLHFHDIDSPVEGSYAPDDHSVGQFLHFLESCGSAFPILIHCYAGISRSTAGAYIALNYFRSDETEHFLAQELRFFSPSATPNRLMVRHADTLLGRGGRMVEAIESIGRGALAYEGNIFTLSTTPRIFRHL